MYAVNSRGKRAREVINLKMLAANVTSFIIILFCWKTRIYEGGINKLFPWCSQLEAAGDIRPLLAVSSAMPKFCVPL